MRGLYAIVDVDSLDARGIDPLAFAEAVLLASPTALQLRAKHLPPREALALLRELAPRCRRLGVPLVANDRPDLAILSGCDLVHVGQNDMPIDRVRRLAPGLGVGVSTHSLEQLDAALATRPSYVALGPVFETTTKKNPDPVVDAAVLRTAHARCLAVGVPLVAIGGITRDRARDLVPHVEAVAVISALLPARGSTAGDVTRADLLRDVTARARAFQDLFVAPAPPLQANP
jgi:thiamine-phosphate pyrophosphorylase